jgi:hypothetical protein
VQLIPVLICMSEQENLFAGGLEQYPMGRVVFGNLLMLLWFALGALACWFFYPLLGLVYLVVAFVMVYIVLRKIICVNCYYYGKRCSLGWGKLCAVMFKKGRIEDFPNSIGLKLAPATYGVLMIVPLILLIVSILQGFSWYKIIVLILLLFVSFYSGSIGRQAACSSCKMNLICTGSVTKKKKE